MPDGGIGSTRIALLARRGRRVMEGNIGRTRRGS